jgi:5-formyltetrahydrofolate cyclo-ligase
VTTDNVTLRRELRHRRAALDEAQRRHAAARIADTILRTPRFLHARHVAVYLPVRGEADPLGLVAQARRLGKRVYLPVLAPLVQHGLWFLPWDQDTPLHRNRFGIPEPVLNGHTPRPPSRLDLVITPLVAFDANGHRLGMGKGYYDRTFAFLRRRGQWRKPYLLGCAYGFQEVSGLTAQPWDIPLHGVVTEQGWRHF